MTFDFRKTFQPTEEEKKQIEENFTKLWNNAKEKRNCITCANRIHVRNYPGFVLGEENECAKGLECDTILDTIRNCEGYEEYIIKESINE